MILGRKATAAGVASLGLFLAGVLTYALLVASPDEARHAMEHAFGGTVAGLLVVVLLRLKKPRREFVRVALTVLVVALSVAAIGQIAESIGALGPPTLHDVAVLVSPFALFVAFGAVPWLITGLFLRTPGRTATLVNIGLDGVLVAVFVYLLVTGQ